MTQTSRGDAVSNFSSWLPEWLSPEWLKKPSSDSYILCGIIITFLILIVIPLIYTAINRKSRLRELLEEGSSLLGDPVPHPMYPEFSGYEIENIELFKVKSKEWAKQVAKVLIKESPATEIRFNNPPAITREKWANTNADFYMHLHRIEVLRAHLAGENEQIN